MATTTETTTLTRVGDQWAMVLDQAILDRLGITAETALDVRTDGRSVVISPRSTVADPVTDAEFNASVAKVMTRYAETFRELAK